MSATAVQTKLSREDVRRYYENAGALIRSRDPYHFTQRVDPDHWCGHWLREKDSKRLVVIDCSTGDWRLYPAEFSSDNFAEDIQQENAGAGSECIAKGGIWEYEVELDRSSDGCEALAHIREVIPDFRYYSPETKHERWFATYDDVVSNYHLGPAAGWVYIQIKRHTVRHPNSPRFGTCTISQKQLAEAADMPERSVRAAIAKLVALHLVIILKKPAGPSRVTTYQVTGQPLPKPPVHTPKIPRRRKTSHRQSLPVRSGPPATHAGQEASHRQRLPVEAEALKGTRDEISKAETKTLRSSHTGDSRQLAQPTPGVREGEEPTTTVITDGSPTPQPPPARNLTSRENLMSTPLLCQFCLEEGKQAYARYSFLVVNVNGAHEWASGCSRHHKERRVYDPKDQLFHPKDSQRESRLRLVLAGIPLAAA